jgi:hypothetical protein
LLTVGVRRLCATLSLLGELQPLARKLFVAPLAFFVPAVGEILVFFRARSSRLVPGRAAARCEEVRRHGDLHLPLTACSLVRSFRSRRDCHHKNAFSHWTWALPYSTPGTPAEWSGRRCPTARKPASRLRAPQRIGQASPSQCHPVRSPAAASPRDLPPVDTRRRRHHSEPCDAPGAERSVLTTERCSFA